MGRRLVGPVWESLAAVEVTRGVVAGVHPGALCHPPICVCVCVCVLVINADVKNGMIISFFCLKIMMQKVGIN